MSKIKAWLYAFRLRTLPLAFSSIITGSAIAFKENREKFSWLVFVLTLITTLLLQILSNLANDYGDSEKGTDNDERIGPKRAVQSGMLSIKEIKAGIFVAVILCLISGSALVNEAFRGAQNNYSVFFFILGLCAIAAAIKYTVGKNAYGYMGMGDVFVFLFFGVVGVGGTYFLFTHHFNYSVLLMAFCMGAFSAGVLNLNNMRDLESDANAGKNTLAVRLGLKRAKHYHMVLIILADLSAFVFVAVNFVSTIQFLFIITFPLIRKHVYAVREIENPKDFDPLLKQLALTTFVFSVLFAVGYVAGEA